MDIEALKKPEITFSNVWDGSLLVIHPIDIWHNDVLHDGIWSFFIDSQHISSASNEYVVKRLIDIFQEARMQP